MANPSIPDPQRLRRVPQRFSWVDHRLVRDKYFQHRSLDALALYLFLVVVSDARGISFYSQPSLMKQLRLGTVRFMAIRQELIDSGLIAWRHPLYQVLSLNTDEKGVDHD